MFVNDCFCVRKEYFSEETSYSVSFLNKILGIRSGIGCKKKSKGSLNVTSNTQK
jgi:hypothetical protein